MKQITLPKTGAPNGVRVPSQLSAGSVYDVPSCMVESKVVSGESTIIIHIVAGDAPGEAMTMFLNPTAAHAFATAIIEAADQIATIEPNTALTITTPNPGGAEMSVIAHATNGKPGVGIVIKKQSHGVQEALLDGEPAWLINLGEGEAGKDNAPWEMGHLLAQKWDEAQSLAKQQPPQQQK